MLRTLLFLSSLFFCLLVLSLQSQAAATWESDQKTLSEETRPDERIFSVIAVPLPQNFFPISGDLVEVAEGPFEGVRGYPTRTQYLDSICTSYGFAGGVYKTIRANTSENKPTLRNASGALYFWPASLNTIVPSPNTIYCHYRMR